LLSGVYAIPQLDQALATHLGGQLFSDVGHQLGEYGVLLPATKLGVMNAELGGDLSLSQCAFGNQLGSFHPPGG
jgi:hypothetical protein